ncbi:hypothetical protein Val02_38950 [Virgisporangium aliadipatigenens]|uniref:Pentapeptide repeat-containing protein n=1 Tax=Virgisporangium aliadipatigenens TaxID=741659 RepID=A0A8J3YKB3_9ACTN|nr:pentapeptide repeat-containing protein [Virgisporangium aliadipatigenens]GIJ47009.1 hypothetical protein Val02_38950 [Virgisporangium aliadipatigenens]
MNERLRYGARRGAPWFVASLATVVVLIMYAFAIEHAPEWLNPMLRGPSGANLTSGERMTATHNARLLLVSIGGALVVLTGLAFTAVNYRLAHRGQATERFTKALERLGSEELYIRIGGIHSLQRLLLDAASLHSDIVEVLVAFVRDRSPRSSVDGHPDNPIWPRRPMPAEPAADVQAALTVIAGRPRRPEAHPVQLNFSGLDLRGVNLAGAWLDRVNFSGSRLDQADLSGAAMAESSLRRARLTGARLEHAILDGADLAEARFDGSCMVMTSLRSANLAKACLVEAEASMASFVSADARGAILDRAIMVRTELSGASLAGSSLVGAVLRNAFLYRTNLDEASLDGADLFFAVLIGAQLRNAQLVGADLSAAALRGANLAGANMERADLSGAGLMKANLSGVCMKGADLSRANLLLVHGCTWEQVEEAAATRRTWLPRRLARRRAGRAAVESTLGT